MSLVGKKAPAFRANAILPDGEIREDFSLESLRGRHVVLFFYPLDFTFVCPSEILAFDHRVEEFRKRGAEVVAVSVDSHYTHLAWRGTKLEDGGIGPVRFPLVADLSKQIARDYGVLTNDEVALRGTFLIDRDGVVQHEVVNALGLGRNVDDELRTLDALQHLEEYGEVCPANWRKGDEAMKATPDGVKAFLRDHGKDL